MITVRVCNSLKRAVYVAPEEIQCITFVDVNTIFLCE